MEYTWICWRGKQTTSVKAESKKEAISKAAKQLPPTNKPLSIKAIALSEHLK
jgi:hypothetical protein